MWRTITRAQSSLYVMVLSRHTFALPFRRAGRYILCGKSWGCAFESRNKGRSAREGGVPRGRLSRDEPPGLDLLRAYGVDRAAISGAHGQETKGRVMHVD